MEGNSIYVQNNDGGLEVHEANEVAYNTQLICREEVYSIVSCAFEVLNTLGHGLLEKPYKMPCAWNSDCETSLMCSNVVLTFMYKGVKVGDYIPDLLAFENIVIDTKTIDRITNIERGQVLNYLKITGCKVGLILNFKHPRLEWERLVL